MPEDTQVISQTRNFPRAIEELRSLPMSETGFVAGLSGEEAQELADALGWNVRTTLPSGNFLSVYPQEEDDPDRLDLGPAA